MLFLTSIMGFWLMLFISVILALSSHSLFFSWVSLEMNMVSVAPLLGSLTSPTSSEVTLKYFISQSVASILFLFFFLFSVSQSQIFEILSIMILFKLGLPPFHSWLASIVLISPYKIIFLILIVQKFIPLHILNLLSLSGGLIIFMSIMTFFLSSMCLKNIYSIRVTLLISAWGNTVWMAAATAVSKLWLVYLVFYGLFLMSALLIIYASNAQKFSSLLSAPMLLKFFCVLNFFNLAGLPPLSGFFIKLIILKSFFSFLSLGVIVGLLNLSLVVLFAYLSISYYLFSSIFIETRAPKMASFLGPLLLSILSIFSFPLLSIFSL